MFHYIPIVLRYVLNGLVYDELLPIFPAAFVYKIHSNGISLCFSSKSLIF